MPARNPKPCPVQTIGTLGPCKFCGYPSTTMFIGRVGSHLLQTERLGPVCRFCEEITRDEPFIRKVDPCPAI